MPQDPDLSSTILKRNLTRVEEEIHAACQQAGRDPREVQLVAVTKYVGPEWIRMLAAAGCRIVGENRGDALKSKCASLGDLDLEWHFIGHLQRNKIKWVLPHARLIHSVDSLRLLEAIHEAAADSGEPARVLLEVNISGEAQKHGLEPQAAIDIAARGSEFAGVQIEGVMGMAGLDISEVETRRQFASLRQISETLRSQATSKDPFREISMGMSGDFPLAIAEGATLVRIGSRLFEDLDIRH